MTANEWSRRLTHARVEYDRLWRYVDDELYALCAKYPEHGSLGHVAAKVTLIGRSYASGIERQMTAGDDGSQGLVKLVEWMHAHGDAIDRLLVRLRPYAEPLTAEYVALAADVHLRMLELLQPAVAPSRTPRSFVSKYLHFHAPLTPIYDSIAWTAITPLVRKKDIDPGMVPVHGDSDYVDYLKRFWTLYQQAQMVSRNPVSVKLLDYALLTWHNASVPGSTPA